MKAQVTFKSREYNYITPAYPSVALQMAKNWQASHNMPVLAVAIDHQYKLQCKNCNGFGKVMMKFCSAGPFPNPISPKEVVTWFDGNGVYGKGFYVVEETRAFNCPLCSGQSSRQAL